MSKLILTYRLIISVVFAGILIYPVYICALKYKPSLTLSKYW